MSSPPNQPVPRNVPEGSSYERMKSRRKKRKGWKRVQKDIGSILTAVGCFLGPSIYKAMWWLICATSKVRVDLGDAFPLFTEQRRSMVSLLWHQNIFPVAYLFRKFKVTALAGTGTSGRVATVLLESCNFEVFRGGRKRAMVVRDMISHLESSRFVCYGIAVDGSKGPAKIMKPGGCTIARKTRSPVILIHMEAKLELYTPTWDRMALALPFNHFEAQVVGPYWVEPDCTEERFTAFCKHIENELRNLEAQVAARLGKPRRSQTGAKNSEAYVPQVAWPEGQTGIAFSNWDLQSSTTPPWAREPQV